jgi:hypothetical protein
MAHDIERQNFLPECEAENKANLAKFKQEFEDLLMKRHGITIGDCTDEEQQLLISWSGLPKSMTLTVLTNFLLIKTNTMRTVTVHIFDKDSSASMSDTIVVSDDSVKSRIVKADKKRIQERRDEIFANADKQFSRYFYEVETYDDLTQEELDMLEELELEII